MKFKEIPIDRLVKRGNVRKERDTELTDLEQSVGEYDILQPVIVTPRDDGRYDILCGHRRVEVMKRRNEQTVPCIIRDDLGDCDRLYVQVVENVNRKQMSAQELVDAFESMKKSDPRLTDRVIAKRIGKPESFVYMQYQAVRMLDEMYGDGKAAVAQKKSKTAGQAFGEYKKFTAAAYKNADMRVECSGRTLKISFREASKLVEFLDALKTKYKIRRTEV